MNEHELFVCDCGDVEHQFIISKSDNLYEEEPLLYLLVKLNPQVGFFNRLLTAVLYIFGKKSIFGDFEEIIINKEMAGRLIKVLTTFVEGKENIVE